jgi:hypothetical protein
MRVAWHGTDLLRSWSAQCLVEGRSLGWSLSIKS